MTATAITQMPTPPPNSTMTGVHLYDVVDQAQLTAALTDNHVRQQTHPTEPLAILNYTEVCAYDSVWNPTTLACRGLIYRTDTGQVVARGFTKFFNHGQDGAAEIALDAPVHVTDKADGSLGIVYPLPTGGWAVATRGSFASDQAIHATAVLNERYPDYRPLPGVTTLVEIVYPQNRIVLDYAGLDDLILLGGVVIATGEVYGPGVFADHRATRVDAGQPWTGPVTKTFTCQTLAEVLALEPRPNAEGVVVRCLNTGGMIKIKQADYVALHAIVTNLTARKIHEWLVGGKPVSDFVAALPDEFHPWCHKIADGIRAEVDAGAARLNGVFEWVVQKMPPGWSTELLSGDRQARATFAKVAAQHPDKWALFRMLDGGDIRPELLKRAQPGPFITPSGRTFTEDVA